MELIDLDALLDFVLGAKMFGSDHRMLLALDVANENRATILRLRYYFGDGTVGESNSITNLQVKQIHHVTS